MKAVVQQVEEGFRTAIALGNAYNGKLMLKVAKTVFNNRENGLEVTAFHFTVGSNVNPIYEEKFYEENFQPVLAEADRLNIPIHTEYGITDDLGPDVVRYVNKNKFDFLLIGGGLSLAEEPFFKEASLFKSIGWLNNLSNQLLKGFRFFYPSILTKDKTDYFVKNSNCNVGIFLNRDFTAITNTLVSIYSEQDDLFLFDYAYRLMNNNPSVTIDILDRNNVKASSDKFAKNINDLQQLFPNRVRVVKSDNGASFYSRYSFMLISYPSWNKLIKADKQKPRVIPSTLIINKKQRISTR
mgnify:CR=1 FL=1